MPHSSASLVDSPARPRPDWWPLLVWAGDLHMGGARREARKLDDDFEQMALARFDAVVIPALREGRPSFDSETCRRRGRLPRAVWKSTWRRDAAGSPFERAMARAIAAGIRPWAQIDVVCGGRVDLPGPSLAGRHPRWTVRNALGRPTPIGDDADRLLLCPANADVARLLGDVAVEIAGEHPVSAVVLDLRALAASSKSDAGTHCLCHACQELAEQELELDLQEVLEEAPDETWDEWQTWRGDVMCRLLRAVRTRVWSVRPGLPVVGRVRMPPPPAELGEADSELRETRRETLPPHIEWARRGLIDMLLMDQGAGTEAEAERRLLDALARNDPGCLCLPLFHESPALGRSDGWARAAGRVLPGWGLTQRLGEAWAANAILKPGERDGAVCVQPALEHNPLAACIEALEAAEVLLPGNHLGQECRHIRTTLLQEASRLGLTEFEGFSFQLLTVATVLEQEQAPDGLDIGAARGWVEMARRLLLAHMALRCRETYLFDAG